MPKIPTFSSQGTITTQAGAVTTNIQANPRATTAGALAEGAKVLEDYYIKQRDNNEKLEARKKYYELKSEKDKIFEKYENNPDEFASVEGFNKEYDAKKSNVLSGIKNRRVKKRLTDLLEIDIAEDVYKVKKNSFKAFEREDTESYNNIQNTLANEYDLEENENLKNEILMKRIVEARDFAERHDLGSAWLKEEERKINGDSELFNAEKAIANKDFKGAKEILRNSTSIDNESLENELLKIEKQEVEYNETSFHSANIINGNNTLIGADLKNTTEKKVLQNTENILIAAAEKSNFNAAAKFAYVDDKFANTGLLSPSYKDLLQAGYATGSSTSFDNEADIPAQLKTAVQIAEIADKTGRLNAYTSSEEERFYKNVIVLKKVVGLNDFEAIKRAKEFEMNYDKKMMSGMTKQRNRALDEIEGKFEDVKATNIGEVRTYASRLYDIYISIGVDDRKAREQVVEDIEKNLIEIDNHAYFRRDIEPFKTIGGLDQVKGMKEYILDKRIEGADKDEYFLRHNGGGQFEIRKRVDLSVVYGDDNEPLIFYQKDLYKLYKDREAEGKKIIKEEALTLQEKKQEAKQEAESFKGISP
ncbi:MAG: hypothetical protein MKZ96_06060 [Candidatus Atelocyanobacterium sp. ALOHA_A2.5_9]|nr:hypothetical protein [Candidatus Atelocyanobacterium sp. ALOHA_A2.5_9]